MYEVGRLDISAEHAGEIKAVVPADVLEIIEFRVYGVVGYLLDNPDEVPVYGGFEPVFDSCVFLQTHVYLSSGAERRPDAGKEWCAD